MFLTFVQRDDFSCSLMTLEMEPQVSYSVSSPSKEPCLAISILLPWFGLLLLESSPKWEANYWQGFLLMSFLPMLRGSV